MNNVSMNVMTKEEIAAQKNTFEKSQRVEEYFCYAGIASIAALWIFGSEAQFINGMITIFCMAVLLGFYSAIKRFKYAPYSEVHNEQSLKHIVELKKKHPTIAAFVARVAQQQRDMTVGEYRSICKWEQQLNVEQHKKTLYQTV